MNVLIYLLSNSLKFTSRCTILASSELLCDKVLESYVVIFNTHMLIIGNNPRSDRLHTAECGFFGAFLCCPFFVEETWFPTVYVLFI